MKKTVLLLTAFFVFSTCGFGQSNNSPSIQGKLDAKEFYHRYHPAKIGTGLIAIISPLGGLIPAIICSSKEPKNENLNFPNVELMKDPEYKLSYQETAHKIKKRQVWKGYAIGTITSILISIAVLSH